MPYGDDGEILNSLNFKISSDTYVWGPFSFGTDAFPNGNYPVNFGGDNFPIWYFGTNVGGTNQWTAASVTAFSTMGTPDAGIENSGALVSITNIEIYVKAQLFIIKTSDNTIGATLVIPVTGLNTAGGATINIPYTTWQPLQVTGLEYKIVMRVYIAHFAYSKGCWSGGDHSIRVIENTINSSELVPIAPGEEAWEQGWVDDVGAPVIATWSGTQVLQRSSGSPYILADVTMESFLSAILPSHPVNGAYNNLLGGTPTFDTPDTLKVNVV